MADKPHPVDLHVGSRVRLRRTLCGMSQQRLAGALGLTFQQIQKYERGANRIGASRLFELSEALEVKPSFFFEEMPEQVGINRAAAMGNGGGVAVASDADELSKREILELVRAYHRISDRDMRDRVFALVKAVSASLDEAVGGG